MMMMMMMMTPKRRPFYEKKVGKKKKKKSYVRSLFDISVVCCSLLLLSFWVKMSRNKNEMGNTTDY